ncbi:MAG: hypothetical protein GXY33_17715 [Phycisphaerae bacterium]|nr:hypothetical protein [Phycisphaerae bacterium]
MIQDNSSETAKAPETLPTTLRQRRTNLYRGVLAVMVVSAVMLFFVVWYKSWPQKLDCRRAAVRLAIALEQYGVRENRLPSLLDVLDLRSGRYRSDHYEYPLAGFGGSPMLPEGSIVAYCAQSHTGLLHDPGRHVLVFHQRRIVVLWLDEARFQQALGDAVSLGPFISVPRLKPEDLPD